MLKTITFAQLQIGLLLLLIFVLLISKILVSSTQPTHPSQYDQRQHWLFLFAMYHVVLFLNAFVCFHSKFVYDSFLLASLEYPPDTQRAFVLYQFSVFSPVVPVKPSMISVIVLKCN